jgi:hypothetical protein
VNISARGQMSQQVIGPTECVCGAKVPTNEKKLKVKKIYLNSNLNSYNVVLNPYGGVYPECVNDR